MQAAIAMTRSEERLQRLGLYFQVAFADHQRLVELATAAVSRCESSLTLFRVPSGSGRWSRLRDLACAAELSAVEDSNVRLRRTSRLIRSIPATTVVGLSVKAKCLPFDTCGCQDRDDTLGSSEVDIEALSGFIDEIERLTFGPSVGRFP